MTEKTAEGVVGFILWVPNDRWFRIYDENKKHKDYKLCADDIEVKILSSGISLYEASDHELNRLDWSMKTFHEPSEDMKKLNESSAKGVDGFLLYNPFDKTYFFRVYEKEDKNKFKDYRLAAEDIQVQILCPSLSLYDDNQNALNKLDYSSKTLGK